MSTAIILMQKKNWFRRFGSYVNKKMAEYIIGQPKTLHTTSFFIVRDFIIKEIVRYPNPFPYISGLVFRATKNLERRDRASSSSSRQIGLYHRGPNFFMD